MFWTPRYGEPVDDEPFLPGLRGTVEKMTVATEAKETSSPSPTKVAQAQDIDLSRTTSVGNRNVALLKSFGASVNGTWDLVASLSDRLV